MRAEKLMLTPRCYRSARPLDFLDRCQALTLATRVTRAALWTCLGAVAAFAALTYQERNHPAPALALPPVVEHSGERFSIYRLPLEVRGAVVSCRLVIYRDERTWSVSC